MHLPKFLGHGNRYRIEDEVGRGGMGAVYRAFDKNTGNYVAVKIALDSSSSEALALFDKEWKVLAELQQTNVVSMTDRGEFQDGNITRSYFVMPFLRGKTLQESIEKNGPLEVEEVVHIITSVAAGMNAAHGRRIIHRDIKPSNIFLLESGSVVLIDFGVVHLKDNQAQTTLKGTTPYLAPELLDPEKKEQPSPSSDLFSLGVVCYEALTGVQPFMRASTKETVLAVLKEMPKPAYELNRNVNLWLGQVVQKSLAKDKTYRYRSVSEFADKLRRAFRNERIPELDQSAIEPRMRVVREAFAKGQLTSANELLRGVEEEGYVDPSITSQRDKINQALQQTWIKQQCESARLYNDAKEYLAALDKVREVLKVVPYQEEALALRDLIDRDRLQSVLADARSHMAAHNFAEARRAIEEARQIRARDTQSSELLSELARMEEADRQFAEQKETLFHEAQSAYRAGRTTTAVQQLEKLIGLIEKSDLPANSGRHSIYRRLYTEVAAECRHVQKSFDEVSQLVAAGKVPQALTICDQMVATNPTHSQFQALKLELENRERQMRLEYVQELGARLAEIPDLEKRVALLQEAVNRYPGESQLSELLKTARGLRDLVVSWTTTARKAEENDEHLEALERWQMVKRFHPGYPGLKLEILRIEKRRDEQERTERKAARILEIEGRFRVGDYGGAASLCVAALNEFPSDGELMEMEATAREKAASAIEALELLRKARESLRAGHEEEGIQTLRKAHLLDRGNAEVRQFLGLAILDKAQTLLDSDFPSAERLTREAQELIPDDPAIKSLMEIILDRRQREVVDQCFTRARKAAREGEIGQALLEIEEGLKVYPTHRRLLDERAKLQRGQGRGTENAGLAQPVPIRGEVDLERETPGQHTEPGPQPDQSTLNTESVFEPLTKVAPEPEGSTPKTAGAQTAPTTSAHPSITERLWNFIRESRSAGIALGVAAGRHWRALVVQIDKIAINRPGFLRRPVPILLIVAAAVVIVLAASRVVNRQPARVERVTVTITASPPGAEIAVNGRKSGIAKSSLQLAPGSHTVEVSKLGYFTKSVPLTIEGAPVSLDVGLIPHPLTLRIITDYENGAVWLDEVLKGEMTHGEIVIGDIVPGSHSVRVSGPTADFSLSFDHRPGEIPGMADLPKDKIPATVAAANLAERTRLYCNFTAGRISVDGEQQILEDAGAELILANGEHLVELDAMGGKKFHLATAGLHGLTLGVFWKDDRVVPSPSPLPTVAEINALINNGRFREAEAKNNLLLKRTPNHPGALAALERLEKIRKISPW